MKGMVMPGTLFEEMGFDYFGPIDGHDLDTGKMLIYAEKEVVEEIVDDRTEVLLEEAKRFEPDVELVSLSTPPSTLHTLSTLFTFNLLAAFN